LGGGALAVAGLGPQAGFGYSQLVVSGLATLNGTCEVRLAKGFHPQAGDSFQPPLWAGPRGRSRARRGMVTGSACYTTMAA
jgi:hypothetical protein